MLLRLRIQGFKNLRDVDIAFGPVTCFVGPNGVGKSNIFDAIQFLRHLADQEIHSAAESIRRPTAGTFSPLDLFWNRNGQEPIRLEADMLVPLEAEDDFGQSVEPSSSLLTYELGLGYRPSENRLVIVHERLRPRKLSEARDLIPFPHAATFRKEAVKARRSGGDFLSTKEWDGQLQVFLHGDGGSRGMPVAAGASPRTVLGGTRSKEYPTIVAARREMASWHSVHLEPSALRTPDRFGDNAPVDERGHHVAATIRRLAHERLAGRSDAAMWLEESMESVCAEVANQLARLVEGVRDVRVREDEVRQQHILEVRFRGSELWMPPRALSDGTLRYLALVAMQMDGRSGSVLCIEEPENGIEPRGIPSLITLLRDYAVDPMEPVAADNPLRQVILNSHSPEVLKQLDASEVLFVEAVQGLQGRSARTRSVASVDSWRRAREDSQDAGVPLSYFQSCMDGLPRGSSLIAE